YWAPSPVGHWNFDDNTGTTIFDKSGSGSVPTLLSSDPSLPIWSPGKYGTSVLFDGSTDYAKQDNTSPTALIINGHLTVTAWIYRRTSNTADWIVDIGGSGANPGGNKNYGFFVASDSTLRLRWENGATPTVTTPQSTVAISNTSGTWVHVAAVRDTSANTVTFYENAVQLGTVVSYTNDPDGGDVNPDLHFAAASTAGGVPNSPFDGYIDETKVYNYIRTSRQIVEDMNAGHPAPGSPVGSAAGYWKLDEGFGTTAQDSNSLNNDLTLSTASWTNNGKFNKAWNGTGAVWLTRANDADFDFAAADDLSISFWFKSDSATNPASAAEYLLEKGTITNTGTAGYAIYANTSGNVVFGIKDDAAWGASSPNTPAPDDTATSTTDIYDAIWHHIVATKTGTSRIDLYVDGKLDASDTSLAATATLANAIALRVGDDDADAANSFNGDLDEVKIYRLALTTSEVKLE
ncbi:MAG: LamG domain-containing protein, partial [Patescibacteria group bacterium]